MTRDLFGKLLGDKDYISKALFDNLFPYGIQLITKLRKNMCQIEHSRHRSVNGFLFNVMRALVAYSFFAKKPSLNIEQVPDNQLSLVPT